MFFCKPSRWAILSGSEESFSGLSAHVRERSFASLRMTAILPWFLNRASVFVSKKILAHGARECSVKSEKAALDLAKARNIANRDSYQ